MRRKPATTNTKIIYSYRKFRQYLCIVLFSSENKLEDARTCIRYSNELEGRFIIVIYERRICYC